MDRRQHQSSPQRQPNPGDPTTSATDPLIGRRIAQYRIDAVLGSGGMGTVYRAYDLKLERPVALKSVRPGRSQRGLDQFLKEVRTVSTLNDPNIVTIHGFETCDEGRFIVMEFVEGLTLRTLSDVAASGSRLTIDEIVSISTQIASALRVAHAAGIIHRDIKPENVMVREQDRLVKLLDFGLARLMPRAIVRSAGEKAERHPRLRRRWDDGQGARGAAPRRGAHGGSGRRRICRPNRYRDDD